MSTTKVALSAETIVRIAEMVLGAPDGSDDRAVLAQALAEFQAALAEAEAAEKSEAA